MSFYVFMDRNHRVKYEQSACYCYYCYDHHAQCNIIHGIAQTTATTGIEDDDHIHSDGEC